MDYFKNKIAIVTGGASGIGRAISEELGRRGCAVVVTDVNLEGAQQTASNIEQSGGRAQAERLDVSRADDVQSLVDKTLAEHRRLDFMFNNAGIGVGGEVRDLDMAHWRRIIDINLLGVIHGINAVYPAMIKQGSGHIINTASLAGLIGAPAMVPYATTKYAVVGLSTSLRAEARGLGVKVSVVCPGFVQSGIYEAATVAKASMSDLMSKLPFTPMDVGVAAKMILRGVERDRAIIVFPFYARLLTWLIRLNYAMIVPLGNKTVRDFREIRSDEKDKDQSRRASA
jgi:NAD(P)-dependent dehydrogenase (short-subunit alcohol dehydrogenase family)